MKRTTLTERLVRTFPDEIVSVDGAVDFDATIYNLVDRIMEDMEPNYVKSNFGQVFESHAECEDFLRKKMSGLYEECQNFINEHKEEVEDEDI